MNNQDTQDPPGSSGPNSPFALAKSHFATAPKEPTFAEAARNPTRAQQVAARHGQTSTSIAAMQWQRQPGLALISSHFEEAAKAKAEADARKPTPAQMRASHDQETARRREEQSRQKSSAELTAEAMRYAPGAHRGRLLAAAHYQEQQEKAAELMARQLRAEAAAAAPKTAADTSETTPWGRLTARIDKEGWTAEVRAEHDRLMATDQRKAESRQRWDRIRARVRASEAAAAKAPSAAGAGTAAKSRAAWAEKVRRSHEAQRRAGARV